MTHLRHRLRRYNRFTLSLKVMATSPALIRSFYFACFTTGLFTFLFLLMFVERPKQVIYYTDRQQPPPPSSSPIVKSDRIRDKFAIYSCTTPSTTAAIKDYAYYLVSWLLFSINSSFALIYVNSYLKSHWQLWLGRDSVSRVLSSS